METYPKCDFCKAIGIDKDAHFDGQTVYDCWANMCDDCFANVGVGLGLGKGQRLVLQVKGVKR